MNTRSILVQKFGGTSVSTPERRRQVVGHVRRALEAGHQVVIVVSAMGRRGDPYATDTLLDLLRADGGPVDPGDYDLVFTCGEAISVAVMSQALKRAGIPAVGLTAAQARIFTDGRHVESEVIDIDTGRMREVMASGVVPVVTGGQGVAPKTLDYTTLGRGGSDTSGVAIGAALGASKVEIYTDVDGVAVIDPRLVPDARLLGAVSYAAMYELARFGAKVVHPRALLTGWKSRTPIVVRSTFTDHPGTLVSDVPDDAPVVGVALLSGMETALLAAGAADGPAREGWERRLVMSIADSHARSILAGAAADKMADLREALGGLPTPVTRWLGGCCWLSVVGEAGALREHLPRLTTLLSQQAIAVYGCEVGDRRCTFVIPEAARERAAALVHDAIWTTRV
jgi:aspartokinase